MKKLSMVEKARFIKEYVLANKIDPEKFFDIVTCGGYVKGNGMYGMVVQKIKTMTTTEELKKWTDMWIAIYKDLDIESVIESFKWQKGVAH